jgi:hypothetical protein
MNHHYLIIPLLLLAIFGGLFWQYSRDAAAAEQARQTEQQRIETVAATERANAGEKAREEAEHRAAERAAEETRREAARIARREADNHRIVQETTSLEAEVATLKTTVAQREQQLAQLKKNREAARIAVFEAAKKLEEAQVARRTLDLENQRLVTLIANRTALPPPPSS